MNRRLILSLAGALAIGACSDAPTNNSDAPPRPDFIIGGSPDGNAHPYVGLLLFFGKENGQTVAWLCSGALLDANTVLTAGHCTDGATEVRYFPVEKPLDVGPNWFRTGYISGTPITYPGWDGFETFPNTGDVGVVQLKKRLPGPYAQLAPVNGLDALDKHQVFDIVGYGLEDVRPVEVQHIERMAAQTKLLQIQSGRGWFGPYNLKLSTNAHGGICFGDSGGPVLVGDVVYAVNSYLWNSNCTNAGYAFRVDLPEINAWVAARVAE
jgi:hypothetical protein